MQGEEEGLVLGMDAGQRWMQAEHRVELEDAGVLTRVRQGEFTADLAIVGIAVRRGDGETVGGAAKHHEDEPGIR